jgi:polyisoprenoid-binding protein YceI
MHGVSKAVEFPAMIGKTGGEITLNAEFKIKRFDWGIVYKGQADNLIYDDVVIKLDLKAQKA